MIGRRKLYAGIGARETPAEILEAMEVIARGMAETGWTLRTGLSPGADQAFYRGAIEAGGAVELYLPWPGFEEAAACRDAQRGHGEPAQESVQVLVRATPAARRMASSFHPSWAELDAQTRLLRSRDVHQVLGEGLDDPVAVVICWTPDGSLDGRGPGAGGTGQALRVAHAHGIPVYNLARPEHLQAARGGEHGI